MQTKYNKYNRYNKKFFNPNRRIYNRYRRFRFNNRDVKRNLNTNINTRGNGYARIVVDQPFEEDAMYFRFNLVSVLADQEFVRMAALYQEYKILRLVCQFSSSNGEGGVTVYYNNLGDNENVDDQSDYAREISYPMLKPRVIKWHNIRGRFNTENGVMEMNKFNYTNMIPGYLGNLYFINKQELRLRCRVRVLVVFRGRRGDTSLGKVQWKDVNKVDSLQLKTKKIVKDINKKINNNNNNKNNNNNNKNKNASTTGSNLMPSGLNVVENNDNTDDKEINDSFELVNKAINKYNNLLNKLRNKTKDNDNKELQNKYDKLKDKFVILARKVNNIRKRFKIKDEKAINKRQNFIIKKQFDQLKKENDKEEDDKKESNQLNESSMIRFIKQTQDDYNEYKDLKKVDKDLKENRPMMKIIRTKKKEEDEEDSVLNSLFNDSII